MAQKKITDLTLRSDFDATCNIPVDDSSQTWRTTGQQVLDFISGSAINCRYTNTSNQALTADTEVALTGWTIDFDDGSIFNPTTGLFTAPRDGKVRISSLITLQDSAWQVNKHWQLRLQKNGTPNSYVLGSWYAIAGIISSPFLTQIKGDITLNLLATDTIKLSVLFSDGNGHDINASGLLNYVSFEYVD